MTRAGCTICDRGARATEKLAAELDFDLSTTDVDAAAAAGDSGLRAEFGDRLPVVLLDGREHSYWEVDEPRLRKDLDEAQVTTAHEFGGPLLKRLPWTSVRSLVIAREQAR